MTVKQHKTICKFRAKKQKQLPFLATSSRRFQSVAAKDDCEAAAANADNDDDDDVVHDKQDCGN